MVIVLGLDFNNDWYRLYNIKYKENVCLML